MGTPDLSPVFFFYGVFGVIFGIYNKLGKRMTITESQIVKLVTEEMKKADVLSLVKNDKDFEKRVKEIISDTLAEFFRVLWQHSGIFKGLTR